MYRYILICSLFTLIPLASFAQADKDVSYFLDDGGISTAKNTIKTNLLSLVYGNGILIYERKITDGFSLEAGVGIQLGYYNGGIVETSTAQKDLEGEIKGGYNLWIMPKFYRDEYIYNALLYERRSFNLSDKDITFDDISYIFGYQTTFNNWISLDVGTGIGWRIINEKSAARQTESNTITIPILIELGYKF